VSVPIQNRAIPLRLSRYTRAPRRDPTCNEFTNTHQVLQFEAVMWVQDDDHYEAVALPAYPRDLDAAATAINQTGVVGISGH
jgi:hypothetical protein